METAAQRKALGEALARLNENLTTMADLAQLAIRKAMEALTGPEADLVEEVAVLDGETYALQQRVDRQCVELIALHAPVARDLRTVTTSLKITTDLDRIVRYTLDIAELAREMDPEDVNDLKELTPLEEMATHTIAMVDKAVRAFVERDADSVRNIVEEDDIVDDLEASVFQKVVKTIGDQSVRVETGLRYILVSRHLERIADHAVNIGSRVVYMVTGSRLHLRYPA